MMEAAPCEEGEKLMGATAEREGVDREAVLRALVSGGGGGGGDAQLDPEVMAGSSRPLSLVRFDSLDASPVYLRYDTRGVHGQTIGIGGERPRYQCRVRRF